MVSAVSNEPEPKLFSLLPDRRPPWKEFLLSISVQGVGLLVLGWAGVSQLENVSPLTIIT